MGLTLHLLPALIGGAVCLAWAWLAETDPAWRWGVLLAWLALSLPSVLAGLRPLRGHLAWDGRAWTWQARSGSQIGTVRMRLDWQSGLLLEFRPRQGRRQWLWLARRSAPQTWEALRRAVFFTQEHAGTVQPERAHG